MWGVFWSVLFATAPAMCFANGAPYAPMGMGGIEFQHSKDIAMESETLRISSKRIQVSYVFNSSAEKLQTIDMIFPLPPNTLDDAGWWEDPQLQVESGGQKVNAQLHYYIYGRKNSDNFDNIQDVYLDITDYLNGKSGQWALRMNPGDLDFYSENEIVYHCDENEASLCILDQPPMLAYIWKQDFAPGNTNITISYIPSVGGDYYLKSHWRSERLNHGFGTDIPGDIRDPNMTYERMFCVDDQVEAAVNRLNLSKEDRGSNSAFSIFYIWETARYWQGPIKNFHLIIEKDTAEQIISFCPAVGSKTSPTTFEWKTHDFVPQGVLRILFYPYISDDSVQ